MDENQNGPKRKLDKSNDTMFFQLYRMRKETFYHLLDEVMANDELNLVKKKYRGGHFPVNPEKSLLVFLWFISKQDTLHCIGDRFDLVPSTVMQIVNNFLFIVNFKLRSKYIMWPKSQTDYEDIVEQFKNYPGVIGALDGTKIPIKVPSQQHDSYVDRYHDHSITVMAICTYNKIFTYVFTGFPGAAHDSRVFSLSRMARHISIHGPANYFPKRQWHLLGDSAFPLKEWLMTPYRHGPGISRAQRNHNYKLSADRIAIEHAFGLVKGRWRRLTFINTYTVAKAIEIANAAFVLHNFCYVHGDEWDEALEERDRLPEQEEGFQDRNDRILGERKRNNICERLNVR